MLSLHQEVLAGASWMSYRRSLDNKLDEWGGWGVALPPAVQTGCCVFVSLPLARLPRHTAPWSVMNWEL
jgi:hypothetical protein